MNLAQSRINGLLRLVREDRLSRIDENSASNSPEIINSLCPDAGLVTVDERKVLIHTSFLN